MTIKTILKKLTPTAKKAGNAFLSAIREFEELEKNVFVCFVDEGDASWDLRLEVTPKSSKIKSFTCDCGKKAEYCPHKVAVMLHIDKGGKNNKALPRKIVSNKTTKADKLMSEVGDDDKILEWLRDKLNKDKVFRMSFENDLLTKDAVMDEAFLRAQYAASYKTVVGRKKHATAAELPKLLELLKPYIEDAIKAIFNYPSTKETKNLYIALLDISIALKYLTKRPTTRTATFLKKCISNSLPVIPANPDHILKLGNCLLSADHNAINEADIFHPVMQVYGALLDANQKAKLLSKRLQPLMKYMTSQKILIDYVTLAQELNIFSEISSDFGILYYQNKYNKVLITALKEAKLYDRLKKECHKGIKENSPKYQGVYFDTLAEVAALENDTDGLFDLLMLKLKLIPSYEDYKILYNLDLNKKQSATLKKYSEKIVLSSNYSNYGEHVRMKFLYWAKINKEDLIYDKIRNANSVAASLPYRELLWENNHQLYITKVGQVFRYSSFFEHPELIDFLENYIRTKLKTLSKEDLEAFDKKTIESLSYLKIYV